MRWRAVSERIEHISKTRLHQVGRYLEHLLENQLLQIRPVNSDRSAAQLNAVDHHIIVLPANFARIACQKRDILRHRRSERMMARIPAVLLPVERQQWKINHPEKI